MTDTISNAIARLQDIALACTTITIKSAPDYPLENAEPTPFVIAHMQSGDIIASNKTMLKPIVMVNSDFYFSAVNLKQAYQQMDLLIMEYSKRLAGDPTLNGTVTTIILGEDRHPTFENLGIGKWGTIDLQLLRFSIPIKSLETPQSTP